MRTGTCTHPKWRSPLDVGSCPRRRGGAETMWRRTTPSPKRCPGQRRVSQPNVPGASDRMAKAGVRSWATCMPCLKHVVHLHIVWPRTSFGPTSFCRPSRAVDRVLSHQIWSMRRAMHDRCRRSVRYHVPLFFIDAHGSSGGRACPFCRSSIEIPSGDRTNAIRPSRGGRAIVTPPSYSRAQTA